MKLKKFLVKHVFVEGYHSYNANSEAWNKNIDSHFSSVFDNVPTEETLYRLMDWLPMPTQKYKNSRSFKAVFIYEEENPTTYFFYLTYMFPFMFPVALRYQIAQVDLKEDRLYQLWTMQAQETFLQKHFILTHETMGLFLMSAIRQEYIRQIKEKTEKTIFLQNCLKNYGKTFKAFVSVLRTNNFIYKKTRTLKRIYMHLIMFYLFVLNNGSAPMLVIFNFFVKIAKDIIKNQETLVKELQDKINRFKFINKTDILNMASELNIQDATAEDEMLQLDEGKKIAKSKLKQDRKAIAKAVKDNKKLRAKLNVGATTEVEVKDSIDKTKNKKQFEKMIIADSTSSKKQTDNLQSLIEKNANEQNVQIDNSLRIAAARTAADGGVRDYNSSSYNMFASNNKIDNQIKPDGNSISGNNHFPFLTHSDGLNDSVKNDDFKLKDSGLGNGITPAGVGSKLVKTKKQKHLKSRTKNYLADKNVNKMTIYKKRRKMSKKTRTILLSTLIPTIVLAAAVPAVWFPVHSYLVSGIHLLNTQINYWPGDEFDGQTITTIKIKNYKWIAKSADDVKLSAWQPIKTGNHLTNLLDALEAPTFNASNHTIALKWKQSFLDKINNDMSRIPYIFFFQRAKFTINIGDMQETINLRFNGKDGIEIFTPGRGFLNLSNESSLTNFTYSFAGKRYNGRTIWNSLAKPKWFWKIL